MENFIGLEGLGHFEDTPPSSAYALTVLARI